MATFTLTITLGNDAMQTPGDIAEALNRTADTLWEHDDFSTLPMYEGASRRLIHDVNGNTVGKWEVSE